nr:nuclear cap-binding protein subunit 2 [Cryptomonas sp.]
MNLSVYFKPVHEYYLRKIDRHYFYKFNNSNTIYIGNLSYYTCEEQIYEFFRNIGEIKRIIIGLHRFTKTPCGFCFLEFYNFKDAKYAFKYAFGYRIDNRILLIDPDTGFLNGRQFGKGSKGGQIREENTHMN